MKIRAITLFLDPGWPVNRLAVQAAGKFLGAARQAFTSAGYEVQTLRLATSPFPTLLPDVNLVVDLAQELESLLQPHGCEYVSVGPALPDQPASYAVIPEVIAATRGVFAAGLMTTPEGGISLPAVRACAEVIGRIAQVSPDGFANLRFGAVANLSPTGPFLPGAYHKGGRPVFALATEAADLAVTAIREASSVGEAQQAITQVVEQHALKLESVAHLLDGLGPEFAGFDFTLAPFPSEEASFGAAMESLGIPAVGLHGSVTAAAIITSALDQAAYKRVGYNGLMLPVHEDAILARRVAEGVLDLKDLLLYATVCGAGLDTIPLPGDIKCGQIETILLDVAALALRHHKPLIARLMPVPGKRAGDWTEFDFAYFANTRVLKVDAQPLRGLLGEVEQAPVMLRAR